MAVFFDWEERGKHIADYNEDKFDTDFPSTPPDNFMDKFGYESVAEWIIEGIFGLTTVPGLIYKGGSLPGYNIESRDAYQMLQLSLATELVNSAVDNPCLVECYATADGSVEFYRVGSTKLEDFKYLYKAQGADLKPRCDNVMVDGYDPPPKRYSAGLYSLFTFGGGFPTYWCPGEIFPMCDESFGKEGWIEYADPKIGNLVEMVGLGIFNPKRFESVLTYVYGIQVPFFDPATVSVSFSTQTSRYAELSGFGTLHEFTWIEDTYIPDQCLEAEQVSMSEGVSIPETGHDKFLGVQEVIIYGYEIRDIRIDPTDKDIVTGSYDRLLVNLDTMIPETRTLSRGTDYIVVGSQLIFACNVNPAYSEKYGGNIGTGKFVFRVDKHSIFDGKLRDGVTSISDDDTFSVTVFPLGQGQSAYAVEKVVVKYGWNNHQMYFKTVDNIIDSGALSSVTAEFYPIIMRNLPPPRAVNGSLLDPSEIISDLYPETVQNISSTDYMESMSSLEAGDIRVTMPFAGAEDCKTISEAIKSIQNDVVPDIVYMCSPDNEPELGRQLPDGNYVNAIDYSYQDGSQYFISVHAGPLWYGVGSWDQTIYKMRTDRVSLEGVIVGIGANNASATVQVDRVGAMDCVNGCMDVLSAGDRVQVTIYNNPVSY